jgi:hypothetical protein
MPKWFKLKPIPCRVCGLEFTPSRRDAVTCTSTCRKRLQRGHGLDYVKSRQSANIRMRSNTSAKLRPTAPPSSGKIEQHGGSGATQG